MEDNENVVVETTENVEVQATEELVDGSSVATDTEQVEEKLYTQADIDRLVNAKVDELLPRKLERAKSKLQREYQERYGRTETVLNAGLGTSNIEDATKKLSDFYKAKGIVIPDEFVVGFGLDYAEKYRNLDSVAILKPSVYSKEAK